MKNYTFGNTVYSLRLSKHLSQKELGNMLGVSDKAVSRWENGSSQPRSSLLPKLAEVLGVTLDKLLSGREKVSVADNNPASGDFSAQKSAGKGASDLVKVNFIPACGDSNGNYLCTWAMQGDVANKLNIAGDDFPARQRNALNEKTIFDESLYHPYSVDDRKSLVFLLDDGWDVPYNSLANNPKIFGSIMPDEEKFASCGNTPQERLYEISQRVKALGYAGLGLWISPNHVGGSEPFDMAQAREYWEERARWCQAAGVRYWKCDWGIHSRTPGYREMMTECVRKFAPDIIIEHAREIPPFFDVNSSENRSRLNDMCKVFEYSDVLRTYDVQKPFADSETFFRANFLLKNADFSLIRHNAKGLVNVESQPLVAVGLGFNIGVMRYSLETEAALRWQRICPPFSALQGEYITGDETVTDMLRFDADPTWWTKCQWKTFSLTVPMAAARGTQLPKVKADGLKPIVLACSHPERDALAVSTLRRIVDPNKHVIAPADVTVYPKTLKTTVGAFGYYKSLTLEFPTDIPKGTAVWTQCLLDDVAVNVTDSVNICKNRVTLDGLLMRRLGHKSGVKSTEHDPVLIIKLC